MKPAIKQMSTVAVAQPSIRPLREREYQLFQTLVFKETGIHLGPSKQALLVGRLTRIVKELGLRSFEEYYYYVTDPEHPAELVRMIDRICTNETHFFREVRHFEFLEEEVLPFWRLMADQGRRHKKIRVWSAACSTGEEAYSLAMCLLSACPPATGWEIEILATDLSTRALEQARTGIWPIRKAQEIPDAYLKRFMLQGSGSQVGKMKAGEEIRSLIEFRRLNLNEDRYPLKGTFDLIFCRNVLIYFEAQTKTKVVRRLLRHLAKEGLLFVGHSEGMVGFEHTLKTVLPTVYALPNVDWRAQSP